MHVVLQKGSMALSGYVSLALLFFAMVAHGSIDPKDNPVHLSKENATKMYTAWYEHNLASMLSVLASQTGTNLPKFEEISLHVCYQGAKSVPAYAKCLVKAWDLEKHYAEKKNDGGENQDSFLERTLSQIQGGRSILLRRAALRKNRTLRARQQRDAPVAAPPSDDSALTRWLIQFFHGAANTVKSAMMPHGDMNDPSLLGFFSPPTGNWRESYQTLVQKRAELRREAAKNNHTNGMSDSIMTQMQVELAHPFRGNSMLEPLQHVTEQCRDGSCVAEGAPSGASSLLNNMTDWLEIGKTAVEVVSRLTGNDIGEKFPRLLSPKFLSITDEDDDNQTVPILSPDILSLHKGGKNSVGALPDILKVLKEPEREMLMDVVMDVSGAGNMLNMAKEKVVGMGSGPHGANSNGVLHDPSPPREMFDGWLKFYGTLSKDQIQAADDKGYVFLTRKQLEHLYGPGGLFKDVKLDTDLDAYDRLRTDADKEDAMKDHVRRIADSDGFNVTPEKIFGDTNNTAHGVQVDLIRNETSDETSNQLHGPAPAMTLSPLAVHPITGAPIMGHMMTLVQKFFKVLKPRVLSPYIFNPAILAIQVLSPNVMSPYMFSPVINGLQLLSPPVMAANMFSPFITGLQALSPIVLSPNPFSPSICARLLNPKVLSPFVLAPVLFPMRVLSPLVLSPNVLSPPFPVLDVLSKAVLSPTVLSKRKKRYADRYKRRNIRQRVRNGFQSKGGRFPVSR